MDEPLGVRVFFGDPWDAPIVDYAHSQGETPVGEKCLYCEEAIAEGDRGWYTAVLSAGEPRLAYVHAECEILGISGHSYGVCSCNGYGHDRAAAQLLWQRVGEHRGRPLEQLSAVSPWRREAGEWVRVGGRTGGPWSDPDDTA